MESSRRRFVKNMSASSAAVAFGVQLGNIAQRVENTLNIDQSTGNIIGDNKAIELWSRKYEPGWEPKV